MDESSTTSMGRNKPSIPSHPIHGNAQRKHAKIKEITRGMLKGDRVLRNQQISNMQEKWLFKSPKVTLINYITNGEESMSH